MIFLCRSLHVVAQHFSLCKADAFALLHIRLTLWFSPRPGCVRPGVVSPESPWKRLVLTQPSGVRNVFSSWFWGQAGVVMCVCVCVCVCACMRVHAQSCLILCNPLNCSPPGFSVRGILQARILEWVAIPFPRGSSRTHVSLLQVDSLLSEPPGKE